MRSGSPHSLRRMLFFPFRSANGTFDFPLTINKKIQSSRGLLLCSSYPYDRHPYMLVSSLLHLKKKGNGCWCPLIACFSSICISLRSPTSTSILRWVHRRCHTGCLWLIPLSVFEFDLVTLSRLFE